MKYRTFDARFGCLPYDDNVYDELCRVAVSMSVPVGEFQYELVFPAVLSALLAHALYPGTSDNP